MEDQELLIPEHGEDKKLLKLFMVQGGAPAFVLRAKLVQLSWEQVLDRCRQQRVEWLGMVRVRLGLVAALAGDWANLLPLLGEPQLATLRRLHDALQPQLRVAVVPTESCHTLRKALSVLAETLQRFNARWQRFVGEVDLTAANEARDKYNRYYLVEKECVVGSTHLARRGFLPLKPVTTADLEAEFPALPEIDLLGA